MKFYAGTTQDSRVRIEKRRGCVRKPRDDMDETRHENKPMDDPLIIHLAIHRGLLLASVHYTRRDSRNIVATFPQTVRLISRHGTELFNPAPRNHHYRDGNVVINVSENRDENTVRVKSARLICNFSCVHHLARKYLHNRGRHHGIRLLNTSSSTRSRCRSR